MLHTKIVDTKKEKILTSNAEKFIKDSKFGASIYFLGTVRNIDDNKTVTGITYDSHDEMVIKSFEEIYNEANQKLNIKDNISLCCSWAEKKNLLKATRSRLGNLSKLNDDVIGIISSFVYPYVY